MSEEFVTKRDLCFAEVEGVELRLDLHLPAGPGPHLVVVYIHGGGWVTGDKAEGDGTRLIAMAAAGVAVASINYRLAPDAKHPAQVHDAKAAVRWLRANGAEHGLDTARVATWGASAGGYIATMLGLTVGDREFEGSVGAHLDQSSAIEAVVAWFSLGDMVASTRRSALEAAVLPPPFEAALLGQDSFEANDPVLLAANPVARITPAAPPFLIAHGDRDQVVPESQGRTLHDALVRGGGDSTFMALGGVGHEDAAFDRDPVIAMTAAWLRSRLMPDSAAN